MSIKLLNIPNYFSSFYLRGLDEVEEVDYEPNEEFKRWNGTPVLIFRKGEKIVVIDNRDPVGVNQDLYDTAALYFTTNKLRERPDYNFTKIKALFPHYPVNSWRLYYKLFGLDWYRQCGLEKVLREINAHIKRPPYKKFEKPFGFTNYVFFSGSIWKKEEVANIQRAEFVKTCRNNSQLDFEGGLIPRKGVDFSILQGSLGPKRFNWKEFQKKSARSMINFNNPAVLGAVSWRIAEYWNMGTFVLSLPWKVELPVFPKHGKEIHLVENEKEFPEVLDYLINNPQYHQKVSKGGKAYFIKYCEPKAQALRIMEALS